MTSLSTHTSSDESTVTESGQTISFAPEIYWTFSQSEQQIVTDYTTLRFSDKTTHDLNRGKHLCIHK